MHILLVFFFLFTSLVAEQHKGTLIITYKTGEKGERLDRIRFWLIDEHHEQQMYPRKGSFVDDQSSLKRIVVIRDLNPGKYVIDFVVPNQDNLFEYVPPKEIIIAGDKITEIEQIIKPRYSSIQVTIPQTLIPVPKITLKNGNGEIIAMQNELHLKNLIPGEYTLHFEEIPGYKAPPSKTIQLNAGEHLAPITVTYTSTPIEKAIPQPLTRS